MEKREPLMLKCANHGESPMAIVCKHLAQTNNVGYNLLNPPDEVDGKVAWCKTCDNRLTAEGSWEKVQKDLLAVCQECFKKVIEKHFLLKDHTDEKE